MGATVPRPTFPASPLHPTHDYPSTYITYVLHPHAHGATQTPNPPHLRRSRTPPPGVRASSAIASLHRARAHPDSRALARELAPCPCVALGPWCHVRTRARARGRHMWAAWSRAPEQTQPQHPYTKGPGLPAGLGLLRRHTPLHPTP
jgi:hypothetical protein